MINRITFLTNPDKCNLHCLLCFLVQRSSPFGYGEMSFEILEKKLIHYASKNPNLEVIPSTMGEPLLYTHFENFLKLCEKLKLKINLTTNGTLLYKYKELWKLASDIKISCMGFSQTAKKMSGLNFLEWQKNIELFIAQKKEFKNPATLSLQVTLHKKIIPEIFEICNWAKAIGVQRIKWNKAFFLSNAPRKLKSEFELSETEIEYIKSILKHQTISDIKFTGSLFFENKIQECPFKNEIWIYPDGSEHFCPNPEVRFGGNKNATCANCPMK